MLRFKVFIILSLSISHFQDIDEVHNELEKSVKALSGNDTRIESLLIDQIDKIENDIVTIQGDISIIQNDVANMKEMPIGSFTLSDIQHQLK